ncbi:TMEM175 family protein [Streptomyces sp. NPDC050617]|uniref:TMEM175 family protein n=1 Tax=Streptomyces sp. NPDC050617 TaxID=3154628 RepID=UPI00342A92EF
MSTESTESTESAAGPARAGAANIWREHHRTFSPVTTFTRSLMAWNMGWLLSVVVLPVPTEMIGAFGHDRFAGAFSYSTQPSWPTWSAGTRC